MSDSKPSSPKPTSQEKAINEYLEALLLEVPDEELPQPPAAPSAQAAAETPQPEDALPHDEPVDTPPVIGLDQLVSQVPETITPAEISEAVSVETAIEATDEYDSDVPEWAQHRFQCLLFKVSGLSLAVPLVKLNSVIPWNENITQTPNQTEWYLGLIQHLQSQVKVIDTALLVMPENRRDKIDAEPGNRFSHILLVDDFRWGLACDSIGDVIWLEKDDVKWRKDKSSRAWLQGTSLEHLCAIMDTEVFAQMLTEKS